MNINTDKPALRIKTPRLSKHKKKLLFSGVMLVLVAVLLNIFLNSKKQQEIHFIPKDSVTLFLENVMIRESGLFTLLGSKPMTEFDIIETICATEEGIRKEYEESVAFLEKCKQDPEHFHSDTMTIPDFKEFREKCLKHMHHLKFLQHKDLWENWVKEKRCVSSPIYKLTSRGDCGLFINVPNAIYVLKKYYDDFSEITKLKFDVNTILDSIGDNESTFWNIVFKNHYLFGLIMGYGQKNAYLFNWTHQNSLPINTVSLGRFKELSRLNQYVNVTRKKNVSIHDLEIPYFVSFEINNEDMERYLNEQEKIINFLKDKDLISFILNQLS